MGRTTATCRPSLLRWGGGPAASPVGLLHSRGLHRQALPQRKAGGRVGEEARGADEVAEEDRVRREYASSEAVEVDPPAHEEVPREHVRPLLGDEARTPHERHHGVLRAEIGEEPEVDAWIEHLCQLREVSQVIVVDGGHVEDDKEVHQAEKEHGPEWFHDLLRHRPAWRQHHQEPEVLRQEGDDVERDAHHRWSRRGACQKKSLG
mmetsp:Transcript_55486/g.164966  ORF Transcript_55486/g.164966 Transcript_55486/m.164966 type:complete len:206 (+) Transcript_55486:22-639(+)